MYTLSAWAYIDHFTVCEWQKKMEQFSLNETVLACLEISELYVLFWTPDLSLSINLGNKIHGTEQGNIFSRELLS